MRRTSTRPLLAAGMAFGLFSLSACGVPGAAAGGAGKSLADMEPLTLTYSDLTSSTSKAGETVQQWIEELDEQSQGKLVVEPYFSSSLLTSADALAGTGSGVSDITYTVVTYKPQALPVANWINEEGSRPVDSYPHNQLQTVGVMNEMFSTEAAEKEFESQNVKFLTSTSVAGKYDMLCNKELKSQTDLGGLRVRAPGPVWAAEAEALGMTVVSVAQNEAYEALQRGVIDCQIGAPFMYEDYGLSEVAKEYYPATFSANMGLVMLMNLDTWNGLSTEAQQVLQKSMEDLAMNRTQADIKAQQVFFDRRDELGITTHDVTEMNQVLSAFQKQRSDTWVQRAPASVEDPESQSEILGSAMESWAKVLEEDVPLVKAGKVASTDIQDFPAWQSKLAEVFEARTPRS